MATWILGTGGHARALREFVDGQMTDENPSLAREEWFVIGVGDIPARMKLWDLYGAGNDICGVVGAISPAALWPATCRPTLSTKFTGQIMSGAYIADSVQLGVNILFNTGCQVDHDCTIGDHCIISPGAILCGGVKLGEACFVGAGAIIIEGVELKDETYVPAGTLVVGQDDLRKPVRMVRTDRGDALDIRQELDEFLVGR